ncbi:MAG: peptide ABC transporter substrate-binding protein, partial [Magnetococcales bacterium]|nr:peptide ABC transporter substrate-binding protein [Magnetococcales bacterium]
GLVYNNFNMSDPEVGYNDDPERNERNKALRQAIRKGFNWPERIKRFYLGIGQAYPGIVQPGIEGYDPNLSRDAVTTDIAGAKKLLKDNGWN